MPVMVTTVPPVLGPKFGLTVSIVGPVEIRGTGEDTDCTGTLPSARLPARAVACMVVIFSDAAVTFVTVTSKSTIVEPWRALSTFTLD